MQLIVCRTERKSRDLNFMLSRWESRNLNGIAGAKHVRSVYLFIKAAQAITRHGFILIPLKSRMWPHCSLCDHQWWQLHGWAPVYIIWAGQRSLNHPQLCVNPLSCILVCFVTPNSHYQFKSVLYLRCPCFRMHHWVIRCLSIGVCFEVCEQSGFLIKHASIRK